MYRRQVRRADNLSRANRVVEAVNSLGGFKSPKEGSPTMVRFEALQGIFKSVASKPRSNLHASKRETISELLHTGTVSNYLEETAPGTTVRPYQRDLISLPDPGASTKDAMELIDDFGKGLLRHSNA